MARKEKNPDREAGPLEVGLLLLLAWLLFGLRIWRHLHLPDLELPKTPVIGRGVPFPPPLWIPSGHPANCLGPLHRI